MGGASRVHLSRISKARPLYERRTRLGEISTTFAPSMRDCSVMIVPLITAIRFEGSSCQTIADTLNAEGSRDGVTGLRCTGCSVFPGVMFVLPMIPFCPVSFSGGELGAGLLSTGGSIFAGTGLISSRVAWTGPGEAVAGVRG